MIAERARFLELFALAKDPPEQTALVDATQPAVVATALDVALTMLDELAHEALQLRLRLRDLEGAR